MVLLIFINCYLQKEIVYTNITILTCVGDIYVDKPIKEFK